jgi:antitoxin component of RelBE/YafQ-DinJ toxin-antitoxin module
MRYGSLAALAAVSLVLSSPALAVGLGDLAKVVLGGGSVLKKGKEKCGSSLGLTTKEQLQLAFAQAAAEKALPISEYLALDQTAKAEADVASQSPTFCTETKAKKKGLLAKIGKAAKGLAGL